MNDGELARRRVATHQSFYALFPSLPGCPPGVVASLVPSAPERSLFNGVTYSSDARASVALLLPHFAEVYARAGVRAWTVWVLPDDASLASALSDAGHRLDATPEAMGAELSSLSLSGPDVAEAPPPWPFVIGTNALAYGLPADSLQAMALAGDGVRLYGTAGGAVVLAIHEHEGDAGVTYVAARPEVRGRGLVALLLRQALREAADRGCTTTTLESTKLGRPVYERLGYRSLGTLQMWERRT